MNPNVGDFTPAVSAVSIKPPPFWKSSPLLWFTKLEAQFNLAGIVSERTKFNYVLTALDGDILRVVSDVVRNPGSEEPYTNLKASLIQRLSASEISKLNQLLSDLNLGDRQPSQLLREMKELGGEGVPEEFLRSLWLQRLPENVQAILLCNSGSLNELSKCADRIIEVYSKPKMFSYENETIPESSIQNQIKLIINRLDELEGKISKQQRVKYSRARSRSRSKNYPKVQEWEGKSNLCWYHAKFGIKANKCIKPCSFVSVQKN